VSDPGYPSDRSDPGALAEAVSAAARSVPDVHDLHGGAFGEVATYLPGRRVPGVRLTDDGVELHLVTRGTRPLAVTVEHVRDAVRPLVSGRIDVTVEDIAE
jgi:hypothetical protein